MWIFRRDIDMILYDDSDNNTTTDWTTANNISVIINIIINIFDIFRAFVTRGFSTPEKKVSIKKWGLGWHFLIGRVLFSGKLIYGILPYILFGSKIIV